METISKVWPEWKVEKEIGRGSYGTVYKCSKEENGFMEYSAVKVISIPQSEYEMSEIVSEKMNHEQSKSYYKDIADDLVKEIEILKTLKGTKNIVGIYDAEVVEKEDGIGWYILIRMELLTDFNTYSSAKKFSEAEVIKFGLDISDALSVCHKSKIIHRDIKPDNIFVDSEGNFKLGDFGVAKQMEKTQSSMSIKGTYNYMSPEVFNGKKSDGRADMYSLALVMYKLLNNDRLPFLDPDKQLIRYNERQIAFEKRIKGETLPDIRGVSKELNDVILKACAFKNTDRQKNIDEFNVQLKKISNGKKIKRKIKAKKIASIFILICSFFAFFSVNETIQNYINANKTNGQVQQKIILPETPYNQVATPYDELFEYRDSYGRYLMSFMYGYEEYENCLVDYNNQAVVNLYEKYNIDTEDYICMVDRNSLYYVTTSDYFSSYNDYGEEIGYGICKCDLISGEKTVIFRSYETVFHRLVYVDDEYLYFEEIENAETEYIGPSSLKRYNYKDNLLEKIAEGTTCTLVYKGNIIYTTDVSGWYVLSPLHIYNTETKKTYKISDEALTMDEMYFDGDEIYFRETFITEDVDPLYRYENSNIQISKYNITTHKKEVVSDLTETGLDFTAEVGGTRWFNDKYAIVNDDAYENLSIWSYQDKTCEKIQLPENSWVVCNKEISDKLLLIEKVSYCYRLYEILPDGSFMQIGGDLFVKNAECEFIAGKVIAFSDYGETVKIYDFFEDGFFEKVEYTQQEEYMIVGKETEVKIGPYEDCDSLETLYKYTNIKKIAIGSNGWSKVIYNDEIAYVKSEHLKALNPTDEDIDELAKIVDAMSYYYDMKEYDSESLDAYADSVDYILDSKLSVYEYYNNYFGWNKEPVRFAQEQSDEDPYFYIAADPLREFTLSEAYFKFPADKVEWILKNVYRQNVDRINDGFSGYFFDGGYYEGLDGREDTICESVVEKYEKDDLTGLYTFYVCTTYYESYESLGLDDMDEICYVRYKVVGELKHEDSKNYWSIVSVKFNPSEGALKYQEILNETYHNSEDMSYAMFDLNDDGIQEMIVHDYKNYTKHVVYSIIDDKAVEVGSFVNKADDLWLLISSDTNELFYHINIDGSDDEEITVIKFEDNKISEETSIAGYSSGAVLTHYSADDFSELRY